MERDHARWRELILTHEDLEGLELAEADAHLAACVPCRELLARVRELEGAGRPRGMLPPLDASGPSVWAPALREEAAASLRALRARLGAREEPWAAAGSTLARLRVLRPALRRYGMPLALAAGLACAALFVRFGRDESSVRGFRVQPYFTERGGADANVTPAAVAWRTGDPFVLVFDLAKAAYPAVFHVGPTGEVSLLHPADPDASISRLPAGRGHQLPPPADRSVWTLEGEPGSETFLIAAAEQPEPGLARVLAAAKMLASQTPRRQDLLRSLANLLATEVGSVQVVEIEHLP